MSKTKSAAVLTIFDAPLMTKRGRNQVADWLRRQADMLVKDGEFYTPGRFTGRYAYRPAMDKKPKA